MKGQNTFTASEVEVIRKLITEKLISTTNKQKSIRGKIRRKYGFYYSDFSSLKNNYTVEFFDSLIHSGQIKVIG